MALCSQSVAAFTAFTLWKFNNNLYLILSRQVPLLTCIPFVRKYLSGNGVCLMMQVVLALYLCPNLSTWIASRKHVITIVMA